MRTFVYVLLGTLTLLYACSTSSVIKKNATVERNTFEYSKALKEIQELTQDVPSTVVIAGDSLSQEILQFPDAKVESRKVTVGPVQIRSIDESVTELVSQSDPQLTLRVQTDKLQSVNTNGVHSYSKPASLWWWLLVPVGLMLASILIVSIGKVNLGANTQDGAQNGCLFSLLYTAGFIGFVSGFIWLASTVGIFSKVVLNDYIDATWRFVQ
jgi:hypothetical protein